MEKCSECGSEVLRLAKIGDDDRFACKNEDCRIIWSVRRVGFISKEAYTDPIGTIDKILDECLDDHSNSKED